MSSASDLLKDLKTVEKAIVERKQEITKPLMSALSSARDLFLPLEKGYKNSKEVINTKMIGYSDRKDEEVEKEISRVERRVLKGTMKNETAIQKLEEVGEVKKSFAGARSKTVFKKDKQFKIVDESLIPREYLTPDTKKIKKAVIIGNDTISGVEVYIDKSIVSLAR